MHWILRRRRDPVGTHLRDNDSKVAGSGIAATVFADETMKRKKHWRLRNLCSSDWVVVPLWKFASIASERWHPLRPVADLSTVLFVGVRRPVANMPTMQLLWLPVGP